MFNIDNISSKKYSSKIILLGEYGVIHGGEILASPLSLYSAQWAKEKNSAYHQKELFKIHEYLTKSENKIIDLHKFMSFIKEGIYMESDIPTGYGLGSSGTITAGIYDIFAKEKTTDIEELKRHLIDIECCFHKKSSGTDPLVIYLKKSIHMGSNGIHVIHQSIDMSHYFLLDTHYKRKTGPLVDKYLQRAEDQKYLKAIERYKTLNQNAIAAQLKNDASKLSKIISEISRWQYEHLDYAIQDVHKELWKSTLNRADVSLKLCGAGGGGFMIGYAENVDQVIDEFCDFNIIRLG